MTPDTIAAMSPDEKRIAIAEACGVTQLWTLKKRGLNYRSKHLTPLPDYLHDLNAMHEAEKRLTEEQWENLIDFLEAITEPRDPDKPHNIWKAICHATAAQRAEAFLRTL